MGLNTSRQIGVFIAVLLGIAMLASAPSYAAIVQVELDTMGNGDGIIGFSGNTITVDKDFTALGEIFLGFEVDNYDTITIIEDIDNETGFNWIDFHYEIVSGAAEFGSVINIAPFTIVDFSPDNTIAWLSGGVVLAGNGFNPTLGVNIIGFSEIILIKEFPSVPIPAALWLFGSGLIVLIGAARRRKMV